jgi:hypothetical protein
MLVSAVVDDTTITVVRAQENSAGTSHANGRAVEKIVSGTSPGDAQPLKVHAPRFYVRSIAQSSRIPSGYNTLSMTLAANTNLVGAQSAVVTVSGLRGAQTSSAGGFTTLSQDGVNVNVADASVTVTSHAAAGLETGSFVRIDSEVMRVEAISVSSISASATAMTFDLPRVAGISQASYVQIGSEVVLMASRDATVDSKFAVSRAVACSTAAVYANGTNVMLLDVAVLNQGAAITPATEFLTLSRLTFGGLTVGSFIEIDSEIMRVTAMTVASVTVKVSRGVAGTVAESHSDGCMVRVVKGMRLVSGVAVTDTLLSVYAEESISLVAGMYVLADAEAMRIVSVSAVRRTEPSGYDHWSLAVARYERRRKTHAYLCMFISCNVIWDGAILL